MRLLRRGLVLAGVLTALAGSAAAQPATGRYGLIGKMLAQPGKRDELIAILMDSGGAGMPGCLSYVVAKDAKDDNGIWITEVWDDKASHDASLKLPAVQAAIARARPLIAGFSDSHETIAVGGIGLPR